MYNRYIPGSNGIYERRTVHEPPPLQERKVDIKPAPVVEECAEEISSTKCSAKRWLPQGVDIGDLLLLCIVLLLLIDSEEDDILPLLITAAVFLFT